MTLRLEDLPPHLQGIAKQQLAAQRRAAIALPPEDDAAREKATQADCVRVLRALGATVHTTSQSRAAKVTPGLPDIWFAFPQHRLAGWWETKRPRGGVYSDAQVAFAADCLACGIPWGGGPRAVLEAYLIERGVAVRMPGGELEATRPTRARLPPSPLAALDAQRDAAPTP